MGRELMIFLAAGFLVISLWILSMFIGVILLIAGAM